MNESVLIQLDRATIGYDGDAVLRDVSLSIGNGESVAVLGANGSGKSTLVRGILGLAELQAGRIALFGVDSTRFGQRWRIGYVPQRTNIAGALPATVREVVASGRLARLGVGRRLRASDRDAVTRALATVELSDLATRPVAHMSGGQQRRVTIARALAAEPDLLILDEPTAGVDAENQERLAETLVRLHDSGTTIVLIAHELGAAADLIGRVVVMADQGVVFDGPAAGIIPADHSEHLHDHGDAIPTRDARRMGWLNR